MLHLVNCIVGEFKTHNLSFLRNCADEILRRCVLDRFLRFSKNLAGITDLRIHDLRRFATTMLFMEGVADAIIRKMTGHRSEELERYKHFSPEFSRQTTELIAGKLLEELGSTKRDTVAENEKSRPMDDSENTDNKEINGGADGTRTRDLQRDRLKFCLPDFA